MISTLIPSITSVTNRLFGKVPIVKHFNVSYNTSGIGTGKLLCTLRASVARPLLVRMQVEVVTAFNAATANTLIVGTTANGTDLLGTADITEGTPGFYPTGSATGLKRIVANTDIYVNSYGNKAAATLTNDTTNSSNSATTTIGTLSYTMKTALTPANYEVLIGADADATLLNLARAINNSGGTAGTDYVVPSANAQVSASTSVTAHAITLTAKVGGTVGNSIVTTSSTSPNSHMTFGGGVMVGGTDGTTGNANVIMTVSPLFQGT